MKRISYLESTYRELLSITSVISIIFVGILYIFFSALLLNYRLAINTIIGNFPIQYKVSIFLNLFLGIFTSFTTTDFFILLITALLVGINIYLLIRTIYLLEKAPKRIRISIGGATILGLVTTGCTSCGVSLLSILGLSASLSFLPFHGMELHIGAIILLFLSAIYMLKQLWNTKYCKID